MLITYLRRNGTLLFPFLTIWRYVGVDIGPDFLLQASVGVLVVGAIEPVKPERVGEGKT